MPGTTISLRHGTRVLHCDPSGPLVASEQDAVDLIGDAYGQQATLVVLPVERIDPRFFTLSSHLAGEILQKFGNYQMRLAIVGDISEHLARSSALQAFERETTAATRSGCCRTWPRWTPSSTASRRLRGSAKQMHDYHHVRGAPR